MSRRTALIIAIVTPIVFILLVIANFTLFAN